MAYSKQTWENLPNQTTPITAERLNHMEDGIYEAYEHGGSADYDSLPVGSVIDYDGDTVPTGYEEVSSDTKILWTNPNPTEAFGAQNITLSSTDYDILEIIGLMSLDSNVTSIIRILKGYDGQFYFCVPNSFNEFARAITYVNDTTYNVSLGRLKLATSTTPSDDNSRCIPLYVIGYKTGLFS